MPTLWRSFMYSWASAFSASSSVSLFSRNVTFQAFVFPYHKMKTLISCALVINVQHCHFHQTLWESQAKKIQRERMNPQLVIFFFCFLARNPPTQTEQVAAYKTGFVSRLIKTLLFAKCVKNNFMFIWFPLDFFFLDGLPEKSQN